MFDNWSLKKKLSLTFGALLATSGLIMAVAFVNTERQREATTWNTHTYQVLEQAQGMLLNMVNIETGMRGFIASGEDKFLEPFTGGKQAFQVHFDKSRKLTADNPAQQARLDKMASQHQQFMAVADDLIQQRRSVSDGKFTSEQMLESFKAGRDKTAMDGFRADVAEFMKAEAALLDQRSAELQATSRATTYTLIFGGLILFALTGLLGVALTRSIFNQLGGEPSLAQSLVKEVAQGNLDVHVPVRSGDTHSLMARLAEMQSSLVRLVSNVRSNSESVATASAQIAQGNTDLSQRTEEQSSSLQQTSATMHELGTTVSNNADNARQANQLAHGASSVAARGGEVVQQVVVTMKGINDSSKKISDIIAVIDGIAFQTNILALNAAVEAARAGEQGRGFAVVASEVRSLAQRSAGAAKEIKTLITHSVEQVDRGTALVDQAGHTMAEIVSAIQRVSDIVGEISTASKEQSDGVGQVGQTIQQMDQITQQNAALVEESAAAAESLRSQAMQLVEAVSVFKVASHRTPKASTAPVPLPSKQGKPGQARAKRLPMVGMGPSASAAKAKTQAVNQAPSESSEDWETF